MARDITITFEDGSSHVYKGAPDTITPEIVQKRAEAQFGKYVTNIDGGRPSVPVEKGYLAKLKEGMESVIEPAATVASGAIAAPVAGFAGMFGDIYSGLTGGPRIGEDVAADVMKAMTYQPRSGSAQGNLESIGKAFQASKLPVAPQITGGLTSAAMSRLAGPAARQAGALAAEEAAIVAQALPDVGGKMQKGAQNLMLSALKPTPKQYASGAAELAAQELLKRDISPNTKGVMAINQRIAELQSEIAAAIKDSPATIRKQAVLDRLVSVRDRFMRTANPESDLAAIAAAEEGFAAHPLIPGETLSVQLAQDIKQGTYSELRKKYGELGSAQTESQKALARGLKEEVAAKVPEVATLNAEESALLKALDVVERRQFLELNKDPIPLSGALRTPAAWAAFTADKSTAFKALVARLLYKTGKAIKGETPKPPAAPPAPTSTLPAPYRHVGEVNPQEAYRPNWVPGRGYGPIVDEAPPQPAGLLGSASMTDAERLAQNIALRNRSTGIAQQAAEAEAMAAEAAAPRIPTSGGMLYDLDPITGKLRPVDQGIKGATPDVIQSTGNNLSSAAEKIVSGRRFSMSAEERIAWDKAKIDIADAAPQLRGLSDDAIAAKIADRQWVETRIEQLKTEYADWAKEAAIRFRSEQAARINEMANTPQIRTSAERAALKQAKGEASRRMQLAIERRKADMQAKIDALEAMSDQMAGRATNGGIYLGQGPKTRAFQRGMLEEP